jgi:hypothetical protein
MRLTLRERIILSVSAAAVALLLVGPQLLAQMQQSGGGGSAVTLNAGSNLVGKVSTDQTTHGTSDLVASDQIKINGVVVATGNGITGTGSQRVTIASDNTAFTVNAAKSGTWALDTGTAIIGFVRVLPAGCTQTTRFTSDTVGVGTGAGTSVTSTATCVINAFVNNITNSAVTFRLADKSGTPIIWIGGNADFSIPANSNIGLPMVAGVNMVGGITAIAGTGAALNLHVEGYQ